MIKRTENRYDLNVSEEKDIVLLTAEAVEKLLLRTAGAKRPKFLLSLDGIVEEAYMRYMLQVLNANRGRHGFRFRQLKKAKIEEREFYSLVTGQLRRLQMDDEQCFRKVWQVDVLPGKEKVWIWCTKEFFGCCHKDSSVFYYKADGENAERIYVRERSDKTVSR